MSRVIYDSVNRITCPYGNGHNGVDLGWRYDESQNIVHPNCAGTVYATLDNVSDGSSYGGGWGNYVLIRHDNGMFSRYAHLRTGLPVSEGERVDESTAIGIIGASGLADGRHLHFEVQMNSSSASRIDPTRYLTDPICSSDPSKDVNVYYRVRTNKYGWLPEVKNLEDYAGYNDDPITDVAIKVDKGRVEYSVHVLGGSWLSTVSGYNINDYLNGYAGNGQVIDAIKIYYYTPDDIRPYKKAHYKVNNYDWQNDTETSGSQDGFAGSFGYSIKKLYVEIV